MQNVVFMRERPEPPNPELVLNATLFASGAELVQLSGLITRPTPDTMKKLLVADVANEIARLNKAFTDYLAVHPEFSPGVE